MTNYPFFVSYAFLVFLLLALLCEFHCFLHVFRAAKLQQIEHCRRKYHLQFGKSMSLLHYSPFHHTTFPASVFQIKEELSERAQSLITFRKQSFSTYNPMFLSSLLIKDGINHVQEILDVICDCDVAASYIPPRFPPCRNAMRLQVA